MITIPSKFTLGSTDSLLKAVLKNPESVLRFPSDIQLRSILSSAAYIQFLLTWASISKNREIHFTLSKKEHLQFLAFAPETLIPLLVAKRVLVDYPGIAHPEPLDLASIKAKGLEIFSPLEGGGVQKTLFGNDELEFGEIPSKGSKVHLLAADGEAQHAHPNWFYTGSPDSRHIRDSDDLSSLSRNVLNLIRDHSTKKLGRWVDGLPDSLGNMLYELFDNTHKWGREEVSGEPIKMIRGALFDVKFDYPGNRTRMSDIATDIPLIGDFIRFHSTQNGTPNLGLLEMSVFDGGIGLPTRELRRLGQASPTIQQEYEATLRCLRKWGTTSGQKGRGLGLDRVLGIAAERQGFIYLRTGRLVLYRDFANRPESQTTSISDRISLERNVLHDGTTHCESPTETDPVRGTLLSVILPFNASSP